MRVIQLFLSSPINPRLLRSPSLLQPINPTIITHPISTRVVSSWTRSFTTLPVAMNAHNTTPETEESSPVHTIGNWFSVPELRLRDHRFTVPLDYSADRGNSSAKISVFAREVVAVGKEELPLPYLLFLQGGPGFESPRPTEANGWIKKACEEYRVLLLDQRGTGLSTPLTLSSLLQIASAEKLVDYLKHFRADNIVNDAEFIRVRLVPDAGPWTVLGQFENWSSFDTNPLYALMHESIYCQGAPSKWSAHRVRSEHENRFDAISAAKEGRPVLFTGEMVFPWMFDELHSLRPFRDAAHLLAEKKDWPALYDIASLNNNKVPVAAAVYYEDMYVNFKLAKETASQIAGIRLWVTNEFMHSGLRDGGAQVFDYLMGMLNGRKPLF